MGVRSWLRRLGRPVRMMRSVDEALAMAAEAVRGFRGVDAVIAEDGHSALVLAPGGALVVVRTTTRRPLGRAIDWAMLRQTHDGVIAETGDRRTGDILLPGITAIDVRRLGGTDATTTPQRELAEV